MPVLAVPFFPAACELVVRSADKNSFVSIEAQPRFQMTQCLSALPVQGPECTNFLSHGAEGSTHSDVWGLPMTDA